MPNVISFNFIQLVTTQQTRIPFKWEDRCELLYSPHGGSPIKASARIIN